MLRLFLTRQDGRKSVVDTLRAVGHTASDWITDFSVILTQCIRYRQPAPDPHGSRTGSRYDWLTCGTPRGCRRWGRSCSTV